MMNCRSKEIYKKLNKNKYYAFKQHSDGVYWTIFSLWKKFAVIITNFKVANTMKHARKQVPKFAKKIGNPSNDNDLALEIPEPILRDYKKLVEMGEFDSVDELIDTHKKLVRKYQLRN